MIKWINRKLIQRRELNEKHLKQTFKAQADAKILQETYDNMMAALLLKANELGYKGDDIIIRGDRDTGKGEVFVIFRRDE